MLKNAIFLRKVENDFSKEKKIITKDERILLFSKHDEEFHQILVKLDSFEDSVF